MARKYFIVFVIISISKNLLQGLLVNINRQWFDRRDKIFFISEIFLHKIENHVTRLDIKTSVHGNFAEEIFDFRMVNC